MAQNVELPINAIPFQNVDRVALTNFNEENFDLYLQNTGENTVKIKRPGLNSKTQTGGARKIDGMYWWDFRKLVIVVSDGRTYKITGPSGTIVDITGDELIVGTRPTFADNGDTLVIANGGRMVTSDSTTTTFIADPDAPTEVSHVAFLDSFIIANEVGTGRFHFADFIISPTIWNAVDVFTAEADPDPILALYVNKRTIHIFGRESIEFWVNDGVSPFIRLGGTTTARGLMAPYATVIVNETFLFFDERRRLTQIAGTTPSIVNTSFDKEIQSFSTVDDCIADYVTVDGRNFVLFTFPTENKTLVFDLDGNYWVKWSFYNTMKESRDRFIGNAYVYARDFNQHLFGSFNSDDIFEMRSDLFDDNGTRIAFEILTGIEDHDQSNRRKRSYQVYMRLKTGVGKGVGGNTVPEALFDWRDNGTTQFRNFRKIPLNVSGDREFNVYVRNLGQYYSRQWRLRLNDPVPFIVGKAIEKVDVNVF